MIKKRIEVKDIISFISNDLKHIFGNPKNQFVDNISDAANATETTLNWINSVKNKKQEIAESSRAKVIIVDSKITFSSKLRTQKKVLLVVDNPKATLIKVINYFFVEKKKAHLDPTAFIHPHAKIGRNVYIGPNCYIGECVIGDNNIIHPNVCIYNRTTIGNNNVIHSGALICVDGLGCIREEDGKLVEFPQIGGVIIGNDTYIGGNTHIASGSLSDTIIGNGCKINGLCFIGSNVHLHENVWITGSCMLAGSVIIGKNSTIFSRVAVREWCNIGEGATIGMGAVVTKHIPAGETWVGNPARKLVKK